MGKRERLVASASELIHRNGVATTTLAAVAQAADVPPGNVYYYFKTKNELVSAVLASWAAQFEAMLDTLADADTPQARLKTLVRSWDEMRELVAQHGCPIGSLAAELDKADGDLDREAARVLEMVVGWAEGQFAQLGRSDARELAATLVAAVQGAALLSSAFRDAELMRSQVRRIERWIDSID